MHAARPAGGFPQPRGARLTSHCAASEGNGSRQRIAAGAHNTLGNDSGNRQRIAAGAIHPSSPLASSCDRAESLASVRVGPTRLRSSAVVSPGVHRLVLCVAASCCQTSRACHAPHCAAAWCSLRALCGTC